MRTALLAGLAGFAVTAATLAVAQPAAPRTVTRAEVSTKVRDGFTRLDTNKDGFVTKAEGQAAFAARRSQRFDRLDANKDGQLSRQEFATPQQPGAGHRGDGRSGERKRGGGKSMIGFGGHMFDMADANKDGRVSLQEATASALRHFDMADANKDGTVTPDERRQMRQHMHSQHATPK